MLDFKPSLSPPGIDTDARSLSGEGSSISAMSFRITVLRHYRAVYRMGAALLNDASEAEDVTQEAFARYWQHGQTVEKPRHWLMRVARNLCLDRLRKGVREISNLDAAEPAETHDPDWHYEQTELGAMLKAEIAKLPEPQRSLIVLFDLRGMSGAACAEILELSENQVKVYLHRARRRLRLQLEHRNEY